MNPSPRPERQLSPLLKYAKNITSQFGEDGIIEEILRRISPRSRTCIEFGAWDGHHLSNTYHLWHELGWRALLIEGDPGRCEQLRQSTIAYDLVTVVNAFVAPSGNDSLDEIVSRTKFEQSPDLVCIDIDGDDYHILCSLVVVRPRVLLVEYNPTIPPHLDLVQVPGGMLGSSALAIVRAASGKGYTLACMTDTNCIFVRTDEFQKLDVPELELTELFPTKYLSYVLSDYRGSCYLTSQPIYAPAPPRITLKTVLREWRAQRFPVANSARHAETEPRVMPVRLLSGAKD